MRSIYILWCVVFLSTAISCKKDTAVVQENTAPAPASESPEATPQAADNQTNASSSASTSAGGHDYTFLTDKLFHYKAAIGGGKEGQQPFKDEWIDLEPNGTYKAGKLKEQTHTGKWTYNHEKKILFLQPDDQAFKMSEWTVMYNNQMMVWVGTQTYGNNATQVQLAKSDVLP